MCAYNIGSFSRGLLAFFAVTPKHESVGQAENTIMVFFKWNVYASRFFSKNDGAMDVRLRYSSQCLANKV